MDSARHFDATSHNELLLAIQWYLSQSPCKESSEVLRKEIERLQEGSIRIGQTSLVGLIERLNSLVCASFPPVISHLPLRLFASKKQSLCRNEEQKKKRALLLADTVANKRRVDCNSTLIFQSRQLGRKFPRYKMLPKGADDCLVKVWSATSGLLRFTLRGHGAQITDISVADDNSLLASGSLDKTMRVWSLRSAASLALFRHHAAAVTLITFLPYVCGQTRYLLSTGGDCVANFYKYASDDETFSNYEHISFNERASPGSRLVSSCCSPGGNLVVIGDTHRFLRIFRLSEEGVLKLKDIEAHSDRVDSLAWAHSGLRFVSGSKDGVAKVWNFRYNDWESVSLDTKKRDEKLSAPSRRAYKVTMVCWTLEDDFVVTSGSDHALVVWDPSNGRLVRQLEGHKEDTYVLIAHPLYREYVFSAGHDGLFMIWNVNDGALVKRYQNQEEVNGSVPLFDFSISPDGTVVAAVDSLGRLSIFGMGTSQRVKTTPKEQPVTYDLNGELVDEDTAVAPHQMPPPLLVDGDGNEYAMDIQRLVPGRDYLNEDCANEGGVLPSPWLTRDLVQRLPPSTINIYNCRTAALRELEMKDFAREACKKKPLDLVSVETFSARNSARLIYANVQRVSEEPEDDVGLEELVTSESSEDSTFDTSSSSSSSEDEETELSEEDTSDSDYSLGSNLPLRRRKVRDGSVSDESCLDSPKRRSVRRRKKSENGSEEENSEQINTDGSEVPEPKSGGRSARGSTRSTRSRRRWLSSSSEVTVSTASVSTAPTESPPQRATRSTASPGPSSSAARHSATIIEFPSWMRLFRPCRFPYIAQIGDVVVYFRQGHELYLNAVESLRLYSVTQRMRPLAHLDAEEMCLVTEVKYVRRPYRLISVKLARLDENETPTGLVFSVKYHDLENVPDFIILQRLYAESTASIYEQGDQIESILDGHWWSGTIDKKEPYDEVNFPRSHWYSLTVRWDSGEDEKMSPWDVQLIGNERRTGQATDEELFEYSYVPRLEVDWSCCGGTAEQCEGKLIAAIEALQEDDDAKPFSVPVDLKDYPEYSLNVDYPVDLETISKRAQNKYYRRFTSMEQDIKYIAINASIFNEPKSTIVHNSRALVETLIRYLKSSDDTDVRALFQTLKDAPEQELGEYKKPCRIKIPTRTENTSALTVNTFDHNLDFAVTNFSAQEWLNDCARIVDTMSRSAFDEFLVDGGSETLGAAAADGALSLTSILSLIEQRRYTDPQQVVDDVQKLLQSYREFIDDNRSPLYLQSLTFSSRFNNSMAPILAKWKRFQQLNSALHSNENGVPSSCRLRSRRRKSSHVYNTRQKINDDPKSDACPGPSSLRSGRNARMPNGFYRNLNNGIHAEVLELQRNNTRRKSKQKNRVVGPSAALDCKVNSAVIPSEDPVSTSDLVRQPAEETIADELLCSDIPGPSCSKNHTISNGEILNNLNKNSRQVAMDASISESGDEDYVLDDSGEGVSEASDSSYSYENLNSTKKNVRTRKRQKGRDFFASDVPCSSGKSKRRKRSRKLKSSSTESQVEDGVKKKKRRTSKHQRRNKSSYTKENTPESGELTDENSRTVRPRRSRYNNAKYNEDDEPEEGHVTNANIRSCPRKLRSHR
ncbi:unnamed protein product [Enterobius vermicularis]|uniref:Bromo domain-containing protein n=1 Tax=Enterobius vermicularis TaxID=51028 RepID=A0A0N4V817_ENTVE|nr:unnamed protein product [Enterobius vermicularis]